jgi:hypothetical protein
VAEPPPPDEPPMAPPPKEPVRYVSVTLSPLHLFSPIFELQIEAKVIPHLGVAVIGGIGSITVDDPLVGRETFQAYELGGQVVGYPLREFSSLQLGAEVLWVKVAVDDYGGQRISGSANGIAIGPFVGYKFVADIGFTFFVQGGFEYVAAQAEASDDEGNSASGEQSAFIPLLNLNLGWSF